MERRQTTTIVSPGATIRRYREVRDLSQTALAKLADVDQTTIGKIERNERKPSIEVLNRLDSVLHFEAEDREFLFGGQTGTDSLIRRFADMEFERGLRESMDRAMRTARMAPLVSKPYVYQWVWARYLMLRYDLVRSMPLLKKVIARAQGEYELVLCIMMSDMSDGYVISGNPRMATEYAERSETIAQSLLRNASSQNEKQLADVGIARAIIMYQEIAYELGDEAAFLARYEQAQPHLDASNDHYGRTKATFQLALYRFQQGDLEAAEVHLHEAYIHAENVSLVPDPGWVIRDGLFLGKHWWYVHIFALVLDVLLLSNKAATTTFRDANGERMSFDDVLLRHVHHRGIARWSRDFPPFTPRYLWKYDGSAHFERWVNEARELQGVMYLPDMLVSWGDYLKESGDTAGAQVKYREAQQVAQQYDFRLLEQVAAGRLNGQRLGLLSPAPATEASTTAL